MRAGVFVLSFWLGSFFLCESSRIAIIGAGISGSATAYFLSENQSYEDHEIHVFEKSDRVGGRLATVNMLNKTYEVGGSIIHPKNKYARDLATKLGLPVKPVVGKERFSIVGKDNEPVITSSKWPFVTKLKMLFRYKLEYIRLRKIINALVEDFSKIYALQLAGVSFTSPADLVRAMSPGLLDLTKRDFRTYLKREGYGDRFINELVQAMTLVNYGQGLNLHAFVGSVSVAATDDNLWSVEGGNEQLPQALLKKATQSSLNLNLHLNTIVNSVTKVSDGLYEINYKNSDTTRKDLFDAVVVSTQLSDVEFHNMNVDTSKFKGLVMHQTVTTLVAGKLNDKLLLLGSILTCTPGNTITAIGNLEPTKNQDNSKKLTPNVYRIYSPEPLTDAQLAEMFTTVVQKEVKVWKAYPEYSSMGIEMPGFILDDNVYYTNAIEWAASAMETCLISARNAALLINERLPTKKRKMDSREAPQHTQPPKQEL